MVQLRVGAVRSNPAETKQLGIIYICSMIRYMVVIFVCAREILGVLGAFVYPWLSVACSPGQTSLETG